ncbi:MAG: hypothetical protein ACSLEN_01855 [Candidatus Malihini olakiniferum]
MNAACSGLFDELIGYYKGAREKLKAWTIDHQLDGSIDTGILNPSLLAGDGLSTALK